MTIDQALKGIQLYGARNVSRFGDITDGLTSQKPAIVASGCIAAVEEFGTARLSGECIEAVYEYSEAGEACICEQLETLGIGLSSDYACECFDALDKFESRFPIGLKEAAVLGETGCFKLGAVEIRDAFHIELKVGLQSVCCFINLEQLDEATQAQKLALIGALAQSLGYAHTAMLDLTCGELVMVGRTNMDLLSTITRQLGRVCRMGFGEKIS